MALVTASSTVTAGALLPVFWSAIATPTPRDWVGLYAAGAPAASPVAWRFLGTSTTAGSATLGVPIDAAGVYEIRLYADQSTTLLATGGGSITVAGATPPVAAVTTAASWLAPSTDVTAVRWRWWLLDEHDRILAELDDLQSWSYEPRVSTVGHATLRLSLDSPNLALVLTPHLAGIERRVTVQASVRELGGEWQVVDDWGGLISGITLAHDADGRPTGMVELQAVQWLHWLHWRRVLPVPGQDYLVLESNTADDQMKHAVRQSLSDAGDPRRRLTNLTCQANLSQGNPVKYSARYEPLLDVVAAIGGQGRVRFDIVRLGALGANQFQFQTFAPYRGEDRTVGNAAGNPPVLFSAPVGTLSTLRYTRDLLSIRNVTLAAGAGEGAARAVEVYVDLDSVARYGWRETFVDARGASTQAQREAAAEQVLLEEAIPSEDCTLTLAQGVGPRYPIDWQLGDLVTVSIPDLGDGITLHAEVSAVRVERDGESALPRVTPTVGRFRTLLDRIAQIGRRIRILDAR
jgi:hypothetical protein